MRLTIRHMLFTALILGLAPIPLHAALAKGVPVKVVITGPGIAGEVEIVSPALLNTFASGRFEQLSRMMGKDINFRPDVDLGEGYRIDRYLVEGSVWDTLTYYRDPEGGEGYILYEGNESIYSRLKGRWYRATPQADAAMHQVLKEYVKPRIVPALSPNLVIVGVPVMGVITLLITIGLRSHRNYKARLAA